MELVGLKDYMHAYPYELSGGMRQRTALARALVLGSDILLMDEPFSSLDDSTREKLEDEVVRIWMKEKKTIIFVTHNIDTAVYLGNRVLIMKPSPGTIVKDITVSFKRPRNRVSHEFINQSLMIRDLLGEFSGYNFKDFDLDEYVEEEQPFLPKGCCI